MMNGKFKGLKVTGAILILLGIFFIIVGFGKKNNYSNSTYLNQNAYVGGDAYNYIINSGYFTGYVTLGGLVSLGGVVLYSTAILAVDNNNYKKLVFEQSNGGSETNKESEELPGIS